MSRSDNELLEAVSEIISRTGVQDTTPAPDPDGDLAVWRALEQSGFTEIGADGDDGDLTDLLAVVTAAATAGALTPVIEHTVLARWLARRAGYEINTTATVAIVDQLGDGGAATTGPISIELGAVPFATVADTIVIAAPGRTDTTSATSATTVIVIDAHSTGVTVADGTDLTGASCCDITLSAVSPQFAATADLRFDEVLTRAALAYATAMAAAAGSVRDASLRYAGQRIQFGRPLTGFQAITQRLAQLGATAALMDTAARTATQYTQTGSGHAPFATAAAKIVTSSAAREVCAAGHQIHGAIGFTAESTLGRSTTSLLTWRDRGGEGARWAAYLAEQILDEGTDVWDVIVGAAIPASPHDTTISTGSNTTLEDEDR